VSITNICDRIIDASMTQWCHTICSH